VTETDVLFLLREAIRIGVGIAAPILIAALVTGLAIGLLQALTSVQELTLTFVPKLLVIALVLVLTLGFMTANLLAFFDQRILTLF
jgi:flagellar biosynthetic protein FliQ